MAKNVSIGEIQALKEMVNGGNISGAYTYLYERNYKYAGWANGVASGNTIAGVAAVEYLKGTALMGAGGPECQNLSDAKIQNIKSGMVNAYLDTLTKIANENNGVANRDINAQEVWDFHSTVFENNGLGIDNWTLNAPFTIIQKRDGAKGVEDYWKFMRDTGGDDSYEGIVGNLATLAYMHKQAASTDPVIRQMANDWMKNVPGIYDWDQIDRAFETALTVGRIKLGDLAKSLEHAFESVRGLLPDWLDRLITDLQDQFTDAKTTASPLTLDLDGDGVETVSKAEGIHFDHDGNHYAETTGWVGKDDGLLVWDRNGNGQIDNGSELFGNQTILANGSKAANGFAALAELDTNHDEKVDKADAGFAQLRVWKDSDSDAKVSAGELLTLDAAGVANIGLAFTSQTQSDIQGNQHLQVGQYVRTGGSVATVTDVWFESDLARTIETDPLTTESSIADLPDIQGFGNVHSLHQAMALNSSGKLQSLVQEFVSTSDSEARHVLIKQILFTWTGSDQYSATSRGTYVDDGRKIYSLEAFLGTKFVQSSGTNGGTINPGAETAKILLNAYNALEQSLFGQLVAQTAEFKGIYQHIDLHWNSDLQTFDIDVAAVISELRGRYMADPVTGTEFLLDFVQSLSSAGESGTAILQEMKKAGNASAVGFDAYLATLEYNRVDGGSAADILNGLTGVANIVSGSKGNDAISGADKNDVLRGGAGDDILQGKAGNDTYLFGLGDGYDTITETSGPSNGNDVLQLGAGIDAASTQLTREGVDLMLTFNATDKVLISRYFYDSAEKGRVELIKFADGTTWDTVTVASVGYNGTNGTDTFTGLSNAANRINGLDGNDSLNGGDKDDVLTGGAGVDTLDGRSGNDTLVGGTGNDILEGKAGDDTYLFNLGDGMDTIVEAAGTSTGIDVLQLGPGLNASSTEIKREGYDLVLTFNTSDSVRVQRYFYETVEKGRVELIKFADGTVLDYAKVAGLGYIGTAEIDTFAGFSGIANRMYGLGGDDSLYGADKDDVLGGGIGNDALEGKGGSDTYLFNLGDGKDTITETSGVSNGTDVLQLGTGLDPVSTQINREGYDLVLAFNANDSVRIVRYFYEDSEKGRVEQIKFTDGTTWDYGKVAGMGYNGTSGGDILYGVSGVANRINGLAGDDSLYGADKDDILSGGIGNDRLEGKAGNDTYLYELGGGIDTIVETSGTSTGADVLKLGEGLNAGNVQLGREGYDLLLTFNSNDMVRIQRYFYDVNEKGRIESIAFADGTTWDVSKIADLGYGGTSGADSFYGFTGVANRINGLDGNDMLYGADKNDVLTGGEGADKLDGRGGNDILAGGAGNDTLTGGAGSDIFRVVGPDQGVDSIADFTSGLDSIQIVASNFGVTAGAGMVLSSGATTPQISGTVAQFLYNTTSGALYFDQDGTGDVYGTIQIATLIGQKTLVASDIVAVSM